MECEFQQAAKDGDVDLVRQYILAGMDVNQRCTKDGTTALYWAVCANQSRVCRLLLHHGAEVNSVCNSCGTRPLHAAADRGHVGVAIMLLQSGADVNLLSRGRRETALHKAAYRGHYEMCRILLERKIDINKVNSDGNTALDEARHSRNYHVYQLINSYQKDVNRRNKPSTEWISKEGKRSKEMKNFSVPLEELLHGSPSASGKIDKEKTDGVTTSPPEKLLKQINVSDVNPPSSEARQKSWKSQFTNPSKNYVFLKRMPSREDQEEDALIDLTPGGRRLSHEDPVYTTLARIFAETRSDLLNTLTSAAVRQLSEQSTEESPSHLDRHWKVWCLGKDYDLDINTLTYNKIPLRDCLLSRYSLEIERFGRQYSFEIYVVSAVSNCIMQWFIRVLKVPLHVNVFLPLHAFELQQTDRLLDSLPKLDHPAYVVGLVYPIQTTSLNHFVGGVTWRRSQTRHGVGLPERFVLQLFYGLLSGLVHLHGSSLQHEPLTLNNVYLDRDLRPVITGIQPGYDSNHILELFLNSLTTKPPEVESLQQTWHLMPDDEQDRSLNAVTEKADVYMLALLICEIINAAGLMSSKSSRSDPIVQISEHLQHLLQHMLNPKPQHRLTAETARLRVGLLLFGPDPSVQSKDEFKIWYQVALIKLLHDLPRNTSNTISSFGDCTRTIKSSLRYNDVILRRDFMTSYTMDDQWMAYKTMLASNK